MKLIIKIGSMRINNSNPHLLKNRKNFSSKLSSKINVHSPEESLQIAPKQSDGSDLTRSLSKTSFWFDSIPCYRTGRRRLSMHNCSPRLSVRLACPWALPLALRIKERIKENTKYNANKWKVRLAHQNKFSLEIKNEKLDEFSTRSTNMYTKNVKKSENVYWIFNKVWIYHLWKYIK